MLLEALLWLVAVEAIGLATLPLALRLFQPLPSGGYGLGKALGLVVSAYLLWLPAMLGYLTYQRAPILLVLALFGGLCWYLWGDQARRYLRERRDLVAVQEALFLGFGLLALWVRAFNHDIVGQEKFMDLAFFNAFLATDELPAEDAWLSGYGMAYYPFGYFLLSLPTKLAGLGPAYGYNLSLVLVFSLTFLLTAELAANAVALLRGSQRASVLDRSAWGFGLVSAVFVTLCGNLVGPLELVAARGIGGPAFWNAVGVKGLQASPMPDLLPQDGGWWWRSSRVIPTIRPDGITEFPYFSFLLGDLHPHFIALPLLLLVAAVVLVLLLRRRPIVRISELLPVGLLLGLPLATNTWDAATAWLLYLAAAVAIALPRALAPTQNLTRALVAALSPIPLGLVLVSPYFVGYTSQALGPGLVTDQTPLVSLLLLFGPLFAFAGLLINRLWDSQAGGLWLLAAAVVFAAGAALGYGTAGLAALLLLLLAGAAWPCLERWLRLDAPDSALAVRLWLLGLAVVSAAILLGCELVFIRDSFGTRMNTVFKFYYHVWLLLGLATGPILALWLQRLPREVPRPAARAFGLSALAAFLVLGLVYPLAATWTKSNGFKISPTLNGAAFLDRSKPGEAAAIRWLAGRPGRPIVLEAVGGDYQEFARVSTFTGLPTVIGWIGHELQWRGQLDEYARREQDVAAIYQRGSPSDVLRLLRQYRVEYVFVGSLEREKYGPAVDQRLAQLLSPVYQQDGAVVYALPREEPA
jgi:YYY domain-containing protein